MHHLVVMLGLVFVSSVSWGQVCQHGDFYLSFRGGENLVFPTWVVGPQVPGESKLLLDWRDKNGLLPIEPAGSFKVSLWMPSMNHGSAPTQVRRAIDAQGTPVPGVFEVSNIYFVMGGDWQVRVILNLPDGSQETQSIDLNLGGDGGHHH